MAGQRRLEAAAQRRAVNGRNDGLAGILDTDQHLMQTGLLRRLAELGNVGAGYEGASFAEQHNGVGGIFLCRGYCLLKPLTQGV